MDESELLKVLDTLTGSAYDSAIDKLIFKVDKKNRNNKKSEYPFLTVEQYKHALRKEKPMPEIYPQL